MNMAPCAYESSYFPVFPVPSNLKRLWLKEPSFAKACPPLGHLGVPMTNSTLLPLFRQQPPHLPPRTQYLSIDNLDGLPRLAAFQTALPYLSLYRRFGYLHARLLVDLQHQIRELENRLLKFDKYDVGQDGNRLRIQCSMKDIEDSEEEHGFGIEINRRQCLKELQDRLSEYDDLLIKTNTLASFNRPSAYGYASVRNWINDNRPLRGLGRDFIEWKEDLVTLGQPCEWALLDKLLMMLLPKIERWPIIESIFRPRDLRRKTADPRVHLYCPARVEFVASILLTLLICILLIIPVLVLFHLNAANRTNAVRDSVIVLSVFVFVFVVAMSWFTKARRSDVFAASAAYTAVLVVFISSFLETKAN
ncbi:hypothetical protein BDY21DRAFT_309540 [Lineolata rhizophorae]|uniref:DUF6594 domain-containing protein n=1 Tax=Lineolata rhizophorae TaxID=578093 RepID=A0A6A6NRR8_9PEZI|nr:hypothetical protein BDY21DRAFT_309540 [Lineolata rhizophorae]